MTDEAPRVVPRNLAARAAHRVAGNPATSRPEDAVANNYPGLEIDVRNLDRRFFPGLVFDFVARHDADAPYTEPKRYGALLRYVDTHYEPDLSLGTPLAKSLSGQLAAQGATLSSGTWYLDWVEQGGKRIWLYRRDEAGNPQPLDGLYVWRIIRGLEPLGRAGGDGAEQEPALKIGLLCRDDGRTVELEGWRRRFVDEQSGVLSLAYQPGELLQSLCSPWQHDFRDCQCHYWAVNHPDVVFGEALPGEPVLPDEQASQPERAETLLDWLRSDRDRGLAAGAQGTIEQNRPFQIDHYEINRLWQDLNVVVNDVEIGAVYVPPEEVRATPFASPTDLAAALREVLAPLELTLAIEYLYARFSVVTPDEAREAAGRSGWQTLPDDVTFVRHFLLLTAINEMQHLRWANQLLWELHEAGLVPRPDYRPVFEPSEWVPGALARPGRSAGGPAGPPAGVTALMPLAGGWRWRRRALRPLTMEALDDFILDEHPGGQIDATYARVVATLRGPEYPTHLVQVAERIVNAGNEHYDRFRDIRNVLRSTYGRAATPPYLRSLRPGTPESARDALEAYDAIRANLQQAYAAESQNHFERSGRLILAARQAMERLLEAGEALAQRGIGVPFWSEE